MLLAKIRFRLEIFFRFIHSHLFLIIFGIFFGSLISLLLPHVRLWLQYSPFQADHVGLVGQYRPDQLPNEIKSKVSPGLTTVLPNGKTENSPLTASWSIQDNGLLYRFYLNTKLFWHDKSPFQADDINYKISHVKIVPTADNQVDFVLEEPFSPLPVFLSQSLLKKGLLGLGPYRLKSITVNQGTVKNLTLKPIDSQQKYFVYHFYPTETDLITAFLLGEVDQISGISQIDRLNNIDGLNLKPKVESDSRYAAVFLNTRKYPFDKLRFRQALAYTTPKGISTGQNRCLGPISPQSWVYNPTVKPYNLDSQHAVSLSQEIDGNWQNQKLNLEVSSYELLPLAEEITKSWKNTLSLDIRVSLANGEVDKENFDALLAYGTIPPDPDQYLFWHSTQTDTNLTGISDPRLDELLEQGRQILDQNKRLEIYQNFQKFLLEESPAIFLYYPTVYTVNR